MLRYGSEAIKEDDDVDCGQRFDLHGMVLIRSVE